MHKFSFFFKSFICRNSENGTQADYVGASESESESSQRSSTGKDFEILDREELDS